MWSDIIAFFKEHNEVWPMIKVAPFYFGLLILFIFSITWELNRRIYKYKLDRKDSKIDEKNGIIERKDATIEGLNLRIETLKEKLDFSHSKKEIAKNIAENETFAEWQKQELIAVTNETFKNQKVDIDGKLFVDCWFENVTLYYDGGKPFGFNRCRFPGKIKFDASNPEEMALLNLYFMLDDQFKDLKSMVVK